MFKKILIANRGEIACRVIKTARQLGIATVAVYSDADANARHVRLADEAIRIGPAPARESYLQAAHILAAALQTSAEAVHPGYGFLSENADFAEACAQAGIVFIGPSAAAIRAMGSKSAAKQLMEKAGVPLTPGYHGANQDPLFLAEQAASIGYPVLIKASAGGGGRGMRRVDQAADFAAALGACQREASNSFGNDHVLVEKYVLQPRHIEVQIFGDMQGQVVYLFERDCSVQRRHQKVLEESPAPGMTPERRAAMGKAAVDAAAAVGYVGAGTVEFISQQDGSFYFMEMNTRLQVEHPVTEMVTGQDLVEWQLRVASGEPLPLQQEQLTIHGHALEARIYAEDPDKGFLPSTGRLVHLATPSESASVRIDTGVEQGDEITPHYDPMIAKLITWGTDRKQALARMHQALTQYQVLGVQNNIEFLTRLVTSPAFAQADLDTSLIEREAALLFPQDTQVPDEVWLLATLAELEQKAQQARRMAEQAVHKDSPWNTPDGWRLNGRAQRMVRLRLGEILQDIAVQNLDVDGGYTLCLHGLRIQAHAKLDEHGQLQARIAERVLHASVVSAGEKRHVFFEGKSWSVALATTLHTATDHAVESNLRAPMPGKIIALLAATGARVEKGSALLVMEAMKMEHTITAPRNGIVKAFHFAAGEQVQEGAELVEFDDTHTDS